MSGFLKKCLIVGVLAVGFSKCATYVKDETAATSALREDGLIPDQVEGDGVLPRICGIKTLFHAHTKGGRRVEGKVCTNPVFGSSVICFQGQDYCHRPGQPYDEKGQDKGPGLFSR
jgi:hypothetical protein